MKPGGKRGAARRYNQRINKVDKKGVDVESARCKEVKNKKRPKSRLKRRSKIKCNKSRVNKKKNNIEHAKGRIGVSGRKIKGWWYDAAQIQHPKLARRGSHFPRSNGHPRGSENQTRKTRKIPQSTHRYRDHLHQIGLDHSGCREPGRRTQRSRSPSGTSCRSGRVG